VSRLSRNQPIMPTLSRRFKDLRYQLFYGLLLRRNCAVRTLGDPHGICQWTILPAGLSKDSVVYSGGVGDDVSFEHDLVKNYGCQVVLFDPSPIGIQTMTRAENKIPQFHFFPMALAAHKGTLKLGDPRPGDQSWFARDDGAGLEVACTDLLTAMKQNGHNQIDLLKLDIEGSEYEVLDTLLKARLPVHQICVEYHNGIVPGISRSRTIGSILRLELRGYRLIDQTGNNHTFVRRV